MTENTSKSFWDERTEYRVVEPFKSLYKNDKSTGKKTSSTMMWFVFLCYFSDSEASKILPLSDRYTSVGEGLTGESTYYDANSGKLDELIEAYQKQHYSTLELQLDSLSKLLEKRRKHIEGLSYTGIGKEDAIIDKFISNSKSIFEEYVKIQKLVEEEKNSGIARGGQEMSATDRGII